MSDQTSNLTIKIGSTGDFAAFSAARAQADMLKESVRGVREVLGTFGVGFGVAGLVEMGEKLIDNAEAIKRLSEQAGISAQAFQTMSMVAIEAGMDQTGLAQALEFLRKSMGLAEDGASKQNKAISDLGLNTADLLAMSQEDRVEAIAKAYMNSADKGKAWNDVVVLLGRNVAHLQQVLEEYGTKGAAALNKENAWWQLSDADLDKWSKLKIKLEETWMISKSASLRIADALTEMSLGKALAGFIPGGQAAFNVAKVASDYLPPSEKNTTTADGKPGNPANHDSAAMKAQAELAAKAEAYRQEMAANLAALPAMTAAHASLTKALMDEGGAYESNAQKAQRLRAEAAQYEAKAKTDASNPALFDEMVQSVKDQTEASRLRMEANKLDAETEKQLGALREKNASFDAKGDDYAERLVEYNSSLLDIQKQISELDPKSVSYKDDELRLGKESLSVREAIRATEERIGTAELKSLETLDKVNEKIRAIAMAANEHDWNKTDNEKEIEKLDMLNQELAALQQQKATYDAIAANKAKPQAERDGAAKNSETTAGKIDATQSAITGAGPDPRSFTQNFSADLTKIRSQWGSVQQEIAGGLTGQISNAVTAVGNGLDGWLMKTESFGTAMKSVWRSFESSAISAFAQMVAKYAISKGVMFAIDEAMAAKGLLLSIATAAKSLVAWIPSAIAASISSYGIAAAVGAAAVIGILAASGKGFERGGYTGDDGGEVHPHEYVFSAPAVRAIGLDRLEAQHQAARNGHVASASAISSPGGGGGDGNPIHIHAHGDELSALRAAAATKEGRQIIANISSGKIREYRRG